MDKDTLEFIRKWGTTVIVVLLMPVGALVLKANNLQLKEEIQDKYVLRQTYANDISEVKARLQSMEIKQDAVLQNQAAQQEHLKAIEARVERK